jgi:1,4-alpha-glucan branching enzyme
VIINFADRLHQEYELGFPRSGSWRVRFNSNWRGYGPDFKNVVVPDVTVENGAGTLVLPPSTVLVLSQDE